MNQKEIDLINHLLQLREEVKLNEIYAFTDEYLKNHQPSIDLLLRLARLFDLPPIVDDEKSINFINQALKQDPQNPYAVILLAFVYYFDVGPEEIPPHVYGKIENIKHGNPEIQSVIEYVKSWYWKNKDEQKYIECLKKSILLFDKYVNNFDDLGDYYLDENEITKGLALKKIAFQNIKKVYSDQDNKQEDILENFLNNRINGTSVVPWRYEALEKIAKLAESYESSGQ